MWFFFVMNRPTPRATRTDTRFPYTTVFLTNFGIGGVTIASGMRMWPTFGDIIWNTATCFTLVAIPLFVLMGEIILRSGLARRFYGGVADLLRGMPGGLAHANIVGCAAFSALAGSTVATALTVGTVAVPEMRRQGYSDVLTQIGRAHV